MIESIPLILTGIGIIVSILYYTSVLKNAQKARRTEMFLQLYQERFNIEGMKNFWKILALEWTTFEEYLKTYGPDADPDTAAMTQTQWNYYDGVGIMVKDGLVGVDTVFRLMSMSILMVWFKFETVIKGIREESGNTVLGENFEYLADIMLRMRKKRGLSIPYKRLHPTSRLLEQYANP